MRRHYFAGVGLILASLLLWCFYAFYRTHSTYWDGILFALRIRDVYYHGAPFGYLLHPNHLLYEAFGYGLFAFAQRLGLPLDELTTLQLANAALAVLCSGIVFQILRRRTGSSALATLGWVLFSFGALWWKFAADADAYIAATVLLLLAFVFLSQVSGTGWLLAILCHSLAMLFHELAVFFYPAALLLLLRHGTHRFRRCSIYLAATAAIVGIAYYGAYQLRYPHGHLFLPWLSSSSDETHVRYSLGAMAGVNLLTYFKLLVGGKPGFVAEYWSPVTAIAVAVAALSLIGASLFAVRPRKDVLVPPGRPAVQDLAFWIIPYAIFLSVWMPWNGFYKLLIWPALVLLFALWIPRSPWLRVRIAAVVMLAIAIGAWNFAAYVYPHSFDRSEPVVLLAKRINTEMPANAIVYYGSYNLDDGFLEYFAKNRTWRPLTGADDLQNVLKFVQAGSRPVCLETSALRTFSQQSEENVKFAQSWNMVSDKYDVRVACLAPK